MLATERLRWENEPSPSGRAVLSWEEKPLGTWYKVRCIHFLTDSVMKTYHECLSCAKECKAIKRNKYLSLLKRNHPTTHTVGQLYGDFNEAPCLSRFLGDVQT